MHSYHLNRIFILRVRWEKISLLGYSRCFDVLSFSILSQKHFARKPRPPDSTTSSSTNDSILSQKSLNENKENENCKLKSTMMTQDVLQPLTNMNPKMQVTQYLFTVSNT